MGYHLVFDYLAAMFLAISPFAFGFAGQGVNAWIPHVAVGVTVVAVAMVTRSEPGEGARPAPQSKLWRMIPRPSHSVHMWEKASKSPSETFLRVI